MTETTAPTRKQQILISLAEMLESSPGTRITTARLAKHVGVSEAALYRHFPSKAKMFEALIEFIEDSIFSRVSLILADEQNTQPRCYQLLTLFLTFCERNPGITRILTGDPLSGESERLRYRVAQFFDRFEMQLRQVLREATIRNHQETLLDINIAANLMQVVVEGKISQYVRSDFSKLPTDQWPDLWQVLSNSIFMQETV
jgi:TetR/AcrR family transcriptional regulator